MALPKGYTWKNSKTVMSKTGTVSYPALYCPDASLYETLEVSVQVKVASLKKGVAFTDNKTKNKYKITRITSRTAEVSFNGTADKKKTKVTIPATIKFSGRTFKVTSIAKNALKSHKYVKSVTIGKNVTKIDSYAFYNCKKLKTITVQSTKIKTWGKNCIKGIYRKASIKCPKSRRSYYRNKLTKTTGYQKSLKIK